MRDSAHERNYEQFVAQKLTRVPPTGLRELPELSSSLFPHQRDLVAWALRRGRAAIFASTGLGKTAMQLEWARHVPGPVLILAPLAVAAQTIEEGKRIGVEVKRAREPHDIDQWIQNGKGPSDCSFSGCIGCEECSTLGGIYVTNYDRLHKFDPAKFKAVVLDESSIIKHHDAKTFAALTEAFRDTPFKLCATATPSPNDYTELGTHAEFLGVCSRTEMLAEYFCHDGGDTSKWRLKGHARKLFWKWVSTWGALVRLPSDLRYEDGSYALPDLNVHMHTIAAGIEAAKEQGLLFVEPAKTLTERRRARKHSTNDRAQQCAEVVNASKEAWVIWCDLNAEADALAEKIPDAVEIRGTDDVWKKEDRLAKFARGEIRVLISKPSICGWGLNWQHCARIAFVGVSDSWEQYHQAIRRCWRFGQKRAVDVHVFASELEGDVVRNLQRKETDAAKMALELSAETNESVRGEIYGATHETNTYAPARIDIPSWLRSA